METVKRKNYLDYLRILAILMVVFNHNAIYGFFLQFDTVGIKYIVSAGISILCKCGPPLFFMISGALLIGKEESFRQILVHRVPRICIVLVAIALWMSREDFSIRLFFSRLLADSNWFLYAYLAFLLMLPFIRVMVKGMNKKMMWLFLGLSFIFYTVTAIVKIAGTENTLSLYLVMLASDWPSKCWHIVFPIAGYYLANETSFQVTAREKKIQWLVLGIGSALGLICCIIFLYLSGRGYGGADLEFLRQSFIMLPTFLIFSTVQYLDEKKNIRWNPLLQKCIRMISGATFGVFLMNVYFPMGGWIQSHITGAAIPYIGEFIAHILTGLIEFAISTMVIIILRKIPLIRKVL